jgi:hypothetical protein
MQNSIGWGTPLKHWILSANTINLRCTPSGGRQLSLCGSGELALPSAYCRLWSAVRLMKRRDRHGLRSDVATAEAKTTAINLIIRFSHVKLQDLKHA